MSTHANGSYQERGLLTGLRVIDTTRFLAGPFGSMMLADMGAEVVKVESPDGDSTRGLEPYFFNEDSAYFISVNRNKKSVVLDLKTAEGQRHLATLVRSADVVLDNLRPEQRSALSLDYDTLAAWNPAVVSCSLTGFGSSGPYKDRPAYDIVVQALSGVMSLTGEPDGVPVRTGVPIGDLVGGMNLVIGVLGALFDRSMTGKGQHIDISLLDGQVTLLSYLASYFFVSGVVPGPQGGAHDSIPTYNTFSTKDGRFVVLAANTENMWASLCEVLDREDLTRDSRFSTNAARLENKDLIVAILRELFAERESEQLIVELTDAGVPAAPVNNLQEAFADPQVLHRGMLFEVPHRGGGNFRAVGNPIKASRSTAQPRRSPPGLGEHTEEVLADVSACHTGDSAGPQITKPE